MPKYIDKESRRVFEMSAPAFERHMAGVKTANGKPRYELVTVKKKAVKTQAVAEAVNSTMQKLTAKEIQERLKTETEIPAITQYLSDERATVRAAASKRLAVLDAEAGGSHE